MPQSNFHKKHLLSYPPPPIVIYKEKEVYQYWLMLHRHFPKTERLSLGQKINQLFLDILELTFGASYMPPEPKSVELKKALIKLDFLNFFVQIAWENKLIPTEKYAELVMKLKEIGMMLSGWKNSLKTETPAKKAGEKQ